MTALKIIDALPRTDEVRMKTPDGMQIIKEVTGDYPVYPGHPLVIAFEIVSIFPSPDAALKICKEGSLNCFEAVADNRISGGGSEVHRACDLLRLAQAGMPAEELMAQADQLWTTTGAGGHGSAVESGLQQAAKLKSIFPEKLAEWLAKPSA